MAPARDDGYLPEVWGLYSIATLWLVLRFAVCFRTVGLKGLRMDDGLAFIVLVAWTYTCAVIHITYYTGINADFTEAEVSAFVDYKIAEVERGSKLFLGSWYAFFVLIFSLKGIIMILYRRIFFEPWQRRILYITTVLCISGFIGITLAFSLTCLPFREKWQVVPRPPISCTAPSKILITASSVSAVTDVLLLSIPIPLLWVLNKSLRIRIGIFILLASGVFVLAACIIRTSFTIVPNIFVLTMARWGVREFSIAIVAVNTASLRPRKSSLTSTLNHILPLNPEFRLVQESFPEILLETPRLSRSRPPPQPWKLPFPISAPIPPAPKQTPQPQPSPQLRIHR